MAQPLTASTSTGTAPLDASREFLNPRLRILPVVREYEMPSDCTSSELSLDTIIGAAMPSRLSAFIASSKRESAPASSVASLFSRRHRVAPALSASLSPALQPAANPSLFARTIRDTLSSARRRMPTDPSPESLSTTIVSTSESEV
jgi:hypothetical protein